MTGEPEPFWDQVSGLPAPTPVPHDTPTAAPDDPQEHSA